MQKNEIWALGDTFRYCEAHGKWGLAIWHCNEALKKNSKNGWALFYRGQASLEKNDLDKAAADFRSALNVASDEQTQLKADCWYYLGVTFYDQGNKEQSKSALQESLKLEKKSECYAYLGRIAHDNNDLRQAEELYLKALKYNCSNYFALRGMGLIRISEKDYCAADDHLSTLLRAYRHAASAHYLLGQCHQARKYMYDAAVEYVAAYLSSTGNPQNSQSAYTKQAIATLEGRSSEQRSEIIRDANRKYAFFHEPVAETVDCRPALAAALTTLYFSPRKFSRCR